MKVLEFIRENLKKNLKMAAGRQQEKIHCLELAKHEIQRFRTTIIRKEMLATLDDCILQIDSRIKKISTSKIEKSGGMGYGL